MGCGCAERRKKIAEWIDRQLRKRGFKPRKGANDNVRYKSFKKTVRR